MKLKNFINVKLILLFLFLAAFSSLKARYEVSFHIEDVNHNPLAGMSFQVYTLATDSMSWKFIGSASSLSTPFWSLNGKFVNAAISIYDNDGQVFVPADQAQTIAIKIRGQIIRMDYGQGAYGDALISIPDSGPWNIDQGNSSYTFTGPINWNEYQISLTNYMGGDASSTVTGNIQLNSYTYNVGTAPVTRKREGTIFTNEGQTIMGDDNQLVGQYVRKWRYFSGDVNTSSISIELTSAQDYGVAGNYARRYDLTYRNYFNSSDNGGTIKLGGTTQTSPYSTNFYEDLRYNLEAMNQYSKSIYYTFSHWELDGSTIESGS